MAKHERTLTGDVDRFVEHLDGVIIGGGFTARPEAESDQSIGHARLVVRSYERFSVTGSSRVSLCISILAVNNAMAVAAIAAGGSQAVFWKVNRFGERAFLEVAVRAIDSFGS